jgi:GT2 family glycosyltransferase
MTSSSGSLRPLLSFVIPTHNRQNELSLTLQMLGSLGLPAGSAEVVVVDNASTVPVVCECALPIAVLRSSANMGAAGRNIGAEWARGQWLVMLDDDSAPVCGDGLLEALENAPGDAAAVMADIHLSAGRGRERGGLPEVFVGCGVAIRRDAYLREDGYDPAFEYYAEEYDLAAKLIARGHRVVFDPRFVVEHRKVSTGRDFARIVHRLVRNNGWVMQRYAPESVRREMIRADRRRYRSIAKNERATLACAEGLYELRETIRKQVRTPLSEPVFERFTGLSHARDALCAAHRELRFTSAAVVDEGKNHWCVRQVLTELGVRTAEIDQADVLIPGAMSPGPMLDSAAHWSARGARVVCPWVSAGRYLREMRRAA